MTVLVLEDNRESRRALGELLRKISDEIQVELTATKEEALEVLERSDDIDLFLLDINLNIRDDSNMGGLEFAKEIGCYNITLNVWEENRSARKFYENCGLAVQKTVLEKIL